MHQRGNKMRIANEYNHLNAREFLIVNKEDQYAEILNCITSVDANLYMKISCDKTKLGKIFYSQGEINNAIKERLISHNWDEKRIDYYVTGDETTTRDILLEFDRAAQKRIIEERGFQAFRTHNQVDFQKDRIAVEVQFGKYFSVAYDLHVKHTFFYTRNDIDVGVEVIPTKAMEEHMDTGVPWFENEVTNVIRGGRTNPPIPILVIGIEPENIQSCEPSDYSEYEMLEILRRSDLIKLRTQIQRMQNTGNINDATANRIATIDRCLAMIN